MKNIPLKLAATLYGISEVDLHPMRGGHFAHVYSFQRDGQNFVLRLMPPNEDTFLQSQQSVLAWMAYLAEHGTCVPRPITSANGRLIEAIEHKGDNWLASVFTKAEGVLSEELPLDRGDAHLFQSLGRAIGKMHAVATTYSPEPLLQRPGWDAAGNLFRYIN